MKVNAKVPKKINVSLAFTVIHDFMPDYNSKFYNVTTEEDTSDSTGGSALRGSHGP